MTYFHDLAVRSALAERAATRPEPAADIIEVEEIIEHGGELPTTTPRAPHTAAPAPATWAKAATAPRSEASPTPVAIPVAPPTPVPGRPQVVVETTILTEMRHPTTSAPVPRPTASVQPPPGGPPPAPTPRAAPPAPASPSPPAGPVPIGEAIRELHHWIATPPIPQPPERASAPQLQPPEARQGVQNLPALPAAPPPAPRQRATDAAEDVVRISIGTVQVRLDPPAPPPRREPPRAAAQSVPAPPRLARFYLR